MSITYKKIAVSLILIFQFLFAQAQEPQKNNTNKPMANTSGPTEELLVIGKQANKEASLLQDVPQSVQLLDGEDLKKGDINSLEDSANLIPNLIVANGTLAVY